MNPAKAGRFVLGYITLFGMILQVLTIYCPSGNLILLQITIMEITPKQQAVDLIERAKNVLVVSHRNPDGDSLGSILALKLVLEKMDKVVTIASPEKPGRMFRYLPKISEVQTEIDKNKDFVIKLSLEHAQIEKLGYKKNESENTVDIIIAQKDGDFLTSDVSAQEGGAKWDLIIVADTPNMERLSSLAEPADIFFEIPVINIDHHPSNERFGKVNWVELVATSSCEILVSLIEALSKDKQLMDKDVATCLLTGLIYDTSSFQNVNTTPKSLTVAAQLVAAGGAQQEIVKNLYKTKTLETLKLWGMILSSVKEDKMHRFLWSSVSAADIEHAGADESALAGVLDDLLKSASDVDFALLISERDGQVQGSLRSVAKGFNVAEIADLFGGGGHEAASAFRIDGTLKEKEDDILSKIRNFQIKSEDGEKPSQISDLHGTESSPMDGVKPQNDNVEIKNEGTEDQPKADEPADSAPNEETKPENTNGQETEVKQVPVEDEPKSESESTPESISEPTEQADDLSAELKSEPAPTPAFGEEPGSELEQLLATPIINEAHSEPTVVEEEQKGVEDILGDDELETKW